MFDALLLGLVFLLVCLSAYFVALTIRTMEEAATIVRNRRVANIKEGLND